MHPVEQAARSSSAREASLGIELTVYGPKSRCTAATTATGCRIRRCGSPSCWPRSRTTTGGSWSRASTTGSSRSRRRRAAMLRRGADDPDQLKRFFGHRHARGRRASLQESLQLPSFNIRGLRARYVGADARTIIPDRRRLRHRHPPGEGETAGRDDREGPRPHPARRAITWSTRIPTTRRGRQHCADRQVTGRRGGTDAIRTVAAAAGLASRCPTRSSADVRRAAGPASARRAGPCRLPRSSRRWTSPPSRVPIVNFDNNQHGENENLRLGHCSAASRRSPRC